MQEIDVDGLVFRFDGSWTISKYDEWSFYRNQFCKVKDGVKAIDLLAADNKHTVWLIEVKDYRQHSRTKAIDLADEVAQKVFDTLAGLLPAAVNGSDANEKEIARLCLGAKKLRVVLQLEQPLKPSPTNPRVINPANIQQKLRKLVKAIDAHPVVVGKTMMSTVPWELV